MTTVSDPAAADDLNASLGFVRVIELSQEGRARLEYLARMNMCHSGGVVQGGFITGWLDATMAHAILAMTGFDVTPMSLELKVSFFAPTRPGPVFAEAWIEQKGRSTCFAEGRLVDARGVVLAKASSTLRLIDRAKVEAASRAAV